MFRLAFFFSSRRRHTRCLSDWSSDVCSSDLRGVAYARADSMPETERRIGTRIRYASSGYDALDGADALEIGRASCRERGEMSEGSGGGKRMRGRSSLW